MIVTSKTSGLLFVAVFCTSACGDAPTSTSTDPFPPAPDDTLPYVYAIPEQTGDGWTTGSLAQVGISAARITELVDIVRAGTYANVHGIVIVKDGLLVMEEYFSGQAFEAAVGNRIVGDWTHFGRDTPHNLASVTKTVTSTILGIAIDKGFITNVDTAVYDFFPEHSDLRDADKDLITLHDMLTMTSGLDWDEATYGYGDSRNDINALFSQSDPVRYILAKDAIDPPGEKWVYNGGGTNILGQVVRKAADQRLNAFADEHLFGPLGVASPTWIELEGPMTYASGDLKLRPRDMAKVGFLFVNDGQWLGQQVVSPAWISLSTANYAATRATGWDYGYQWWLFDYTAGGETYPAFAMRGWGGQVITVFPTIDMVVALTGGNYLSSDPADAIIKHFILDALIP